MGLDAAIDPVITAMRALAQGGVNANLAELLGVDAIVKTFGHPRPFEFGLTDTDLPALAVYRLRQRTMRQGARKERTQHLTVGLDFTASMRGHNKVDSRWDLLHLVWDELVRVLRAGHHTATASDAALLSLAGVVDFLEADDDEPEARFGYERHGSAHYPAFRATVTVKVRRPDDLSALKPLLSFLGEYRLAGESAELPESEQPLVRNAIPMQTSVVDPDEQTDDFFEVK